MTTKKAWTCGVCKESIASGEGWVLVMDAVTKSYPRQAAPDELPRPEGEGLQRFTMADLLAAVEPPAIAFAALHHACDPDPDTDPYWISVERAESLAAWVGWTHHLCEKRWMGKHDIENMLAYWFENRGESVHAQAG